MRHVSSGKRCRILLGVIAYPFARVKKTPYGRSIANAYPGETQATTNIDLWNLLVVPEKADEKLVYEVVKMLFEKKDELVKVHKDAAFLDLATQGTGASPIAFHPGAVRYFKEKGITVR